MHTIENPDVGVICRVLRDGPDDNYQKLTLTLVAAINAAEHNVQIATPYFLPGKTLSHALQMACLRGVSVEVIVPLKSNLRLIDWAMNANEPSLLNFGIKLYKSSAPFDHSKLFLVDETWSLIGSSNWDARSLELNFEINLECYDRVFSSEIKTIFNQKKQMSQRVSAQQPRPLLLKLRNNFCRIFSPYL